MREWIQSVLRKINHYKAEHRHVLDEAATALQHALPQDDIVTNNVLPFLELPPYIFCVVEDEMEEDDSENDERESDSDMSEAEDDSYYSESDDSESDYSEEEQDNDDA